MTFLFTKLVRYEINGNIHYGDSIEERGGSYIVKRLVGDLESGFSASKNVDTVKKLLCPLDGTPAIFCAGLNYHGHAEEMGLKVPSNPVVFQKSPGALTGPSSNISVHPEVQRTVDYEGEMTVIIGQDAKNVSEDAALDYVLGYTVGNDVSAREYQAPEVCGHQVGYAKSFDSFAPIGPAILSARLVPDPQKLQLVTRVNGEVRQDQSCGEMIWSVRQLIAHLSRGTTLRKGTVIMTGSGMGAGWFSSRFLKHGDTVEIEIGEVGAIRNKVVFER